MQTKYENKLCLKYNGHFVSDNKRIGQGKARFFSQAEYRAFKDDLILQWIIQTNIRNITEFDIEMQMLLNNKQDTNNFLKAIFDSLKEAEIINNDKEAVGNQFIHKSIRKKNAVNELFLIIYY